MIKNVVEYIVKQLVESPEAVSVQIEEIDPKITITVAVTPNDLKRVIGREGRVVRAIQGLINSLETQKNVEVVVNSLS